MSNNLTCPTPTNLDFLPSHGFNMSIEKLPGVAYFCDTASIPALTAGSLSVTTRLATLKQPQSHMDFSPLVVTFHIDSAMTNYRAIFDWLSGVNMPESTDQFSTYYNAQTNQLRDSKLFSNGFLEVLGKSTTPVATVHFMDLFPISLTAAQFTNSGTDAVYLMGVVTFDYTTYKFV